MIIFRAFIIFEKNIETKVKNIKNAICNQMMSKIINELRITEEKAHESVLELMKTISIRLYTNDIFNDFTMSKLIFKSCYISELNYIVPSNETEVKSHLNYFNEDEEDKKEYKKPTLYIEQIKKENTSVCDYKFDEEICDYNEDNLLDIIKKKEPENTKLKEIDSNVNKCSQILNFDNKDIKIDLR
jgi:hypothetical protein